MQQIFNPDLFKLRKRLRLTHRIQNALGLIFIHELDTEQVKFGIFLLTYLYIPVQLLLLLLFFQFNLILLMVFVFSLPRLFSLFRSKSAEERRYFEVTPAQRWIIGSLYFGLIGFLFFAMKLTGGHN